MFCDPDWGDDRLPIRCSGITDKDPIADIEKDINGKIIKKEEKYPIEGEILDGGNEAIELAKNINTTLMARLYVASLKTFEYDLVMSGNFSIMAEIIEEKWPKDSGEKGVKSQCKKIKDKKNIYVDEEEKRRDATYIYKHIENDNIGKGAFSQALLEKIAEGKVSLIVPNYIKKAIIWACGGNCE